MILIRKSASVAVMKALYTLISSSTAIPVYDHIPENALMPFIHIEVISEMEDSTKTDYGATIQVDITNYAESRNSRDVQMVTDSIIQVLKEADLIVDGYYVLSVELVRNEPAAPDSDNVYYSTLSIDVNVQETE